MEKKETKNKSTNPIKMEVKNSDQKSNSSSTVSQYASRTV